MAHFAQVPLFAPAAGALSTVSTALPFTPRGHLLLTVSSLLTVGGLLATMGQRLPLIMVVEALTRAVVVRAALHATARSMAAHLTPPRGARVVGPVPATMEVAKIKMARLRAAGPCTLRSVAH